MESPAASAQVSYSGASNGADRPLPPTPDSELDLYSGGDDEISYQRSFPYTSNTANIGGSEERESYESQGESSRSASHAIGEDVPSSERVWSDVKDGERNSRPPSEELVGPAGASRSSTEFAPDPSQNNDLPSNNSTHTNSSPENPHSNSDTEDNMPFPGRNQPRGSRRVRIEMLPGTVNYNMNQGQANPQYQVIGEPERVVLPRWQPDAEVTTCPICRSVFAFFNRKHHCRKCGKVVCAACSPHRITIPREYIVRPPPGVYASPPHRSRHSVASISSGEGNIEAGERVRLCNPCVPDPNTAPPQVSPPPYSVGPHANNERAVRPEDRLPSFAEHRLSRRENSYRPRPNATPLLPDLAVPSDAVTHLLRGVQIAENPTPSQMVGNRAPRPLPFMHYSDPRRTMSHRNRPDETDEEEYPNQLNHVAVASSQPRFASPDPQPMPQAAPRRAVPEEDLCPICRREYPTSLRDNPSQQESHIQRCIEEQLTRVQGHTAQAGAGAQHPGQLARISSGTRRGMTKYTATARDAINGDECQICLDEFFPSQELALLTCFCKFHPECIQGWWDKGNFGKCPTHDHGL
ncbi:FYVE-domain-containing protein [Mollisia scopiformis]|uniref:FYVE-domain-containing protein n=1 Tax=Mollisia scopiformis TaxID=149040 RepID=A0A194XSP1_MOLSC|nr:FYVE-domain-containing protein [Mollisia scopiformis]KUJ22747.1 FYVE-domain-containing protein [Mollisia scopiformis]